MLRSFATAALSKGSTATFIARNISVREFLNIYESIIIKHGFKIRSSLQFGDVVKHKAIYGSKLKTAAIGALPFGKHMRSGARFCLEAEVRPRNSDTEVNLLMIPYMELFDKPEVFLLSQGWLEKVTDERHCANILAEIIADLTAEGVREPNGVVKGDYSYCPRCGFQSKKDKYCPECRVKLKSPGS